MVSPLGVGPGTSSESWLITISHHLTCFTSTAVTTIEAADIEVMARTQERDPA